MGRPEATPFSPFSPCGTNKEPDLHPALSGDEVYTPSPRRSEGWRGQLFARCSNRTTSKTSILTLNEQRNLFRPIYNRWFSRTFCSKDFVISKNFSSLREEPCPASLTFHLFWKSSSGPAILNRNISKNCCLLAILQDTSQRSVAILGNRIAQCLLLPGP